MIASRLHSWHDNWRVPLQPPPTMQPPPMSVNTRPMLACADGSFLPLVAKYIPSAHGPVFEVDASLCPDVQLVAKKSHSPPMYHAVPVGTSHERMRSGHEGGEQGPQFDYQQRIDAIVATNRQNERIASQHQANASLPILHCASTSSTSITPVPPPNDKKIYCTHWIRHGECDYVQQGCRYKHEMPSLEKLRDIGFTKYPTWWTDKVQYARPNVQARARRDTSAIRRIVEAQLGRTRDEIVEARVSQKDDTVCEEQTVGVDTPVRQRVVVSSKPSSDVVAPPTAKPANAMPSILKRQSTTAPETPPTTPKNPPEPADLVDLISDSESDTLQPALRAPVNSPEHLPIPRQGRFVPYNEPAAAALVVSPGRTDLRSPSPLSLEPRSSATAPRAPASNGVARAPGEVAKVAARPTVSSSPVGYQGKAQVAATNSRITHEAPLHPDKRIQLLEAEISALKHNKPNAQGLSRSKYADRAPRTQVNPTVAAATAVLGPAGDLRARRNPRSRGTGSPVLARKPISAKALAGLQQSREREEKAKENVAPVKIEERRQVAAVAIDDVAVEPRPTLVKGYKYLFTESA